MALPQDRYIHITSGNGSTETTERSLQALVITDAETIDSTTFDTSTLLKCSNITKVGTLFGTSSKEYLWASKYFSYISPSGETPSRLTFAKASVPTYAAWDSSTTYNTGDKVAKDGAYYSCKEDGVTGDWDSTKWTSANPWADDFNRVAAMTNDFAVFTYLTTTMPDAAAVKAIGAANAALNYRFLFCTSMTNADVTTSVADAKAALAGSDGTNGEEITYQRSIVTSGDTLSVPKTYIVAAIISAIDWDTQDGSVNAMFRQISGETADVISETAVTGDNASQGADDLDDANVNYYGLVQTNGSEQSFFQRGFNSDGESIIVYVGELWLKSRISSRLMSMFLNSNKIPANVTGSARVFSEVHSVCVDAVTNGVIEVGKTLDANDQLNVLAWTGDASAVNSIETNGYWLKCWVVKNDDGKGYTAKYLLVYSKGDAIIKVDGTDTFI